MSTAFAKKGLSIKASYHHGNLRKALLEAGVALIGEVGPKGFTIREVARRGGRKFPTMRRIVIFGTRMSCSKRSRSKGLSGLQPR